MQADQIIHDEVASEEDMQKALAELRYARVGRTHDNKGVDYMFGNRQMRRVVSKNDRPHRLAQRQFHMTDKQSLYQWLTAPKNEPVPSKN